MDQRPSSPQTAHEFCQIPVAAMDLPTRIGHLQKQSPSAPGSRSRRPPAAAQPRDWLIGDSPGGISCWILVVGWILSSILDPAQAKGSTRV